MSFQQIPARTVFLQLVWVWKVLTVPWAEKIRQGERRLCNSHRHRRARCSTQRYFRISQEITRSFCERLWEKCDGSEYISTSSLFIVNAAELSAVTFQLQSFFWVFPDQTRCGKRIYSSVLPQDCSCFLWLSSASVSFLTTLDTFFFTALWLKIGIFFFLFISIIQVFSCWKQVFSSLPCLIGGQAWGWA